MHNKKPEAVAMSGSAREFFETLGLYEEPYGIFYTDAEPEGGFAPEVCPPLSWELEQQGKVDYGEVFKHFSCVVGKLWLARKKRKAAWFEAARYGCVGGGFYLGFYSPVVEFVPCYVSTGIPGTPIHGERYLDSPQAVKNWIARLDPRPAPARYCVFKPLESFAQGERPELVTFFARGEVISGLCNLAAFVTNDYEVVSAPFGSVCSTLVSWPLRYLAEGRPRAVLGCVDPSGRKFMKPDEMFFTVPMAMYEQFLARWEDSFLRTDEWAKIQGKIRKSAAAWGE
jgi:hypothetical protein